MSTATAEEISSFCLQTNASLQLAQTRHRLTIVAEWEQVIKPGARILELGDMTAVLAAIVGEKGHVTAVDPAPLDYGAPFTLQQAQAHIKSSRIGSHVTFVKADPIEYLENLKDEKYDAIVLVHCVWYFPSPEIVTKTLAACSKRTQQLCLAEWSLTSNGNNGQSHVLAVLAQAVLEVRRDDSDSNIRTLLSDSALQKVAKASGWTLNNSSLLSPDKSLLDGRWEVQAVLSQHFTELMTDFAKNAREMALFEAMRDALESSVRTEGGINNVTPMQVAVQFYAA